MTPQSLKQSLDSAIRKFSEGRILVIGDLVIDEMIYGNTHRISREAPVLILAHEKTDIILGASGNAAHNIASLNAKRTTIVGVAGKDYYCSLLLDALQRDGIDTTGLVQDESRPTATKTRISGIANQSVTQQIVRVDRESKAPLSAKIQNQLIDQIKKLAGEFDALLLSDYGLGVLSPEVIAVCQAEAKKHSLVMSVDTQQAMKNFQGAHIMTPNQPEAEQNLGYEIKTRDDLLKGGRSLLTDTNAQNMLITRGADGMALFEAKGGLTEIPVFNKSHVFDVTGAGDTVIGTLTLALATGCDLVQAAILGNLAASIVVRQFGAAVTTQAELAQHLSQLDEGLLNKIQQSEVKR